MRHVLLNERLISRDEAKVDIEDRGYQFGDGIYEVFAVYGGKPLLLDEHLRRLERSAEELRLKLPYAASVLKDKLIGLYEADQLVNGIVYVQVTRGVSPRDHAFPAGQAEPQLTAYTIAKERPAHLQTKGVTAVLTEDIRWLRCDIKSLNLLGNVLAKQTARDRGAYEAILHRGPTVTEGSSTNAFIVRDGTVYTHPADHYILNGITRSAILDLCRQNGIPASEERFSVDQLMAADEVFITGTSIDIVPVTQIDGHNVADGALGPVTARLQALMSRMIEQL